MELSKTESRAEKKIVCIISGITASYLGNIYIFVIQAIPCSKTRLKMRKSIKQNFLISAFIRRKFISEIRVAYSAGV